MALWRDNRWKRYNCLKHYQISSQIWTLKLPSVGTPHWCRAAGRVLMLAWGDILTYTENHFGTKRPNLFKLSKENTQFLRENPQRSWIWPNKGFYPSPSLSTIVGLSPPECRCWAWAGCESVWAGAEAEEEGPILLGEDRRQLTKLQILCRHCIQLTPAVLQHCSDGDEGRTLCDLMISMWS